MKQIVDFEQANLLVDKSIQLNSTMYCYGRYKGKGSAKFERSFCECLAAWYVPAPTLGELIEWIDKNSEYDLWIDIDEVKKNKWECCVANKKGEDTISFCWEPELIDALFELVIKIKEESDE